MQSATIDTFLKSKAASISSIKYRGVGLQQCNAKIRDRELSVFSPPDNLFTYFHDFFGGRTLKLTPSLKGSSASMSSSYASPPLVRCWYTSLSLELITPNPSLNIPSLCSLRLSIILFSSCCLSLTCSNYFSRSRQWEYFVLYSMMMSRLLLSSLRSWADQLVIMPESLSAKKLYCQIWSSFMSCSGYSLFIRSVWKIRGYECSKDEFSMEVSRREEFLGEGGSLAGLQPDKVIFSISSRSPRKEQVLSSSRQANLIFCSSASACLTYSYLRLPASLHTSTSFLAFSTLALLSRTSLSSSSIILRYSFSFFLHYLSFYSQAVIFPIISDTLLSSSPCFVLNLSIQCFEFQVLRSQSTLLFFTSLMRLREFYRTAFSFSNSFYSLTSQPFSSLYLSLSFIIDCASPFFCSYYSVLRSESRVSRVLVSLDNSFSRSPASLCILATAAPLLSLLASMFLRSLHSYWNSLMLSLTDCNSRRICSRSWFAVFRSASYFWILFESYQISCANYRLRFYTALSYSWGFCLPLVAALGVKPSLFATLPTISPFISYVIYPVPFLFLQMTLLRWWSFFIEYSNPKSLSSQKRVSLKAKQNASFASSLLHLIKSNRREARGRFSKDLLMYCLYSPIFYRMMQVVLPSCFFFRKSSTAVAVLKSVTTMLSNLPQAVVMIQSCSLDTSPRSPRRPRTPGKPCCMIYRNMFPFCPCSQC